VIKIPRPNLTFWCFATKSSFSTDNYGVQKKVKGKKVRYFAITEHDGNTCYRVVKKDFYMKHRRAK
jgi:hypothetical protein